MAIRDLDSATPNEVPIPTEEIADEILFLLGRIRDLFDRVMLRKKAAWDPATRTRQPLKKTVGEITDKNSITKAWETIEEDSMAHYKCGAIEAFIVRFGTDKYGCEIFDHGKTIDSVSKRNFSDLANYLLETYPATAEEVPVLVSPPVVKRKPGRPAREEATA
jgi:hypothetical protein